jgi:hypothetical protein
MAGKYVTLALGACAVVVTGLLGATVVTRGAPANQDFDEITVRRIRVVEPDGTLRMVISNHDGLPRDLRGNRQGPNRRPGAGILFYNDEGTENGGLIFGGRRDADGKIVDSGVSLSFDKYGVNGQMLQLAGISDKDNRFAGLRIKDTAIGGPNNNRVWVGNTDDGAATVALMDTQGRRRIVMEVKADGSSSLTFFDANGKVLHQLVPSGVSR